MKRTLKKFAAAPARRVITGQDATSTIAPPFISTIDDIPFTEIPVPLPHDEHAAESSGDLSDGIIFQRSYVTPEEYIMGLD